MGLTKHICTNCGIEFENYFSDAKFCSRKCYHKYRKDNCGRKYKTCPVCGKEFFQPHSSAEFCSVKCRVESTKRQILCTCDYCGVEFYRKLSDVEKNRRHYCSSECRKNGMWWSNEDIEVLQRYYNILPVKELSALLSSKRDDDAIRRKAQSIGLGESKEWSPEEKAILVSNYSTMPMCDLMKLLPRRSRSSILGQARQCGLLSYFYLTRNYSEDEDMFIRNNYLSMSNDELGAVLGRSSSGIAQHIYNMDLHRPTEICNYRHIHNYLRSRIAPWRDKYMEENNYTCELTGKYRNVVVHHIRGFNLIVSEAIENTGIPFYEDISLYSQSELDDLFCEYMTLQNNYKQYICISESVHKEFHSIYGYGCNTKEQWDEFVETRYAN